MVAQGSRTRQEDRRDGPARTARAVTCPAPRSGLINTFSSIKVCLFFFFNSQVRYIFAFSFLRTSRRSRWPLSVILSMSSLVNVVKFEISIGVSLKSSNAM